ncbi:MAG TPA: glutamate formiminotransferase [Actinomycetota bacterium]|nr:glutamate formiminotransferase [Actinomycetota bacterium]
MTLVAVPNVSEGRDAVRIAALARAMERGGARILDVHSDGRHDRSVLTAAASPTDLVDACVRLAVEADRLIDLEGHTGVHPLLGKLDVCPFVVEPGSTEAIEAARATGAGIGELGIPVYLYGLASEPDRATELPALRKGGLAALIERARSGLTPDFGPPEIDPLRGVVCVGARGPLIAFNVELATDVATARSIAARVRTSGGGPPGVRALGFDLGDRSQVSVNLIDPEVTGIETVFEAIASEAMAVDVEVIATEIVGLVARRFLPSRDAKATRLLVEPGRSLESVLRR